jgi:Fe-S-cluster containining protein
MKDLEFPVSVREWPLQEKDITSDLCKRCGICCEIELKPKWEDSRRLPWLKAIVENHDNITQAGSGIRIRCSHLRQTKHATNPHWECDIYEDRPQLCRDFNCVSWAKYTGDTTQYNRVLEKMGLNSNQLMNDLELKGSNFSKELQGPDL